jgi:hypothetical protein
VFEKEFSFIYPIPLFNVVTAVIDFKGISPLFNVIFKMFLFVFRMPSSTLLPTLPLSFF